MNRVALLAVAAMVAVAGACSNDGLNAGDARLDVGRNAEVLVGRSGKTPSRVTGRHTLAMGSKVEVVSGSAALKLAGGPKVELRRGSAVRIGVRPTLVDGDLLVTSTGARSLTVSAGGSEVRVVGAARLSRDLALSAASYRGRLWLRSAGRSLEVPALRQGDVASLGVVSDRPEPLDYDPTDAWDRRFLGQAIELGEELEAKSEGFTSSLRPDEGRTPGYFRLLVPALENEPSFGPPLLTVERPPGETLVGATIAVAGDRGSFAARWRKVFAFRADGAPWGLVALDQKVNDAGGLVRSLDAAIGRATLAFAPAGPTTTPLSTAPQSSGGSAGPGATGSGGTGATPTPTPTSPTPTPTPSPTPSPTPTGPRVPPTTLPPVLQPVAPQPPGSPPPPAAPLQPVVDTIVGLLNGL